ncbi:MAG: 4-hydroxythreonine-4-phosphate dehydrogenase PdxA [Bacteroidetes bacterium]|nr:4-hydroxythreonine-4-phosphate dehydrogenase PdxA [Bacteroidota bacterium]
MRIIIAAGDCNGIGLECFVKALFLRRPDDVQFTLAVHPLVLAQAIHQNALDARTDGSSLFIGEHVVQILPCAHEAVVAPGVVAPDAGRHAVESLELSITTLRAGHFDALVTLPVSKEANALAGWPYPGQTEMLAAMCGGTPLMMLCTDAVRVALATIHLPLRDVADALSVDALVASLVALHRALHVDHGIAAPRIAVLGLNPHAGEHGRIGAEEHTIIVPAIGAARHHGVHAEGPFPADGFFAFGAYRSYDGILAMYHDQGLIPLKLLAHGGGVNVTANLSVIRTSPDHGTAFSIAGTNNADPTSTLQAIDMAVSLARTRRRGVAGIESAWDQ